MISFIPLVLYILELVIVIDYWDDIFHYVLNCAKRILHGSKPQYNSNVNVLSKNTGLNMYESVLLLVFSNSCFNPSFTRMQTSKARSIRWSAHTYANGVPNKAFTSSQRSTNILSLQEPSSVQPEGSWNDGWPALSRVCMISPFSLIGWESEVRPSHFLLYHADTVATEFFVEIATSNHRSSFKAQEAGEFWYFKLQKIHNLLQRY